MQKRYILLIACYCAGIFWLSHQSEFRNTGFDFPGKDKVAHMVLYFGLSFLIGWGRFQSAPGASLRSIHLFPVLFVAVYGMSDEIHQLFVPNRNFEWLDWAADIVGACLAQLFLYTVVVRRRCPEAGNETVCESQG